MKRFATSGCLRTHPVSCRTDAPCFDWNRRGERGWGTLAALLLCVASGTSSLAAAEDPAAIEFFEKKVRPVLADRCWSCHGPEAQEGDLRLDSPAAALQGGGRGPAWIPGDPAKSLLVSAINHADTLQMPPKEKLSRAVIADLTEWIRQGAPWPGAPAPPAVPSRAAKGVLEPEITPEQRSFWSFQAPRSTPLPDTDDAAWTRHWIDRFVSSELRAAGLTPSPEAERRQLIRRATLDLWGIPPTVEELQEFLRDDSPDAWERLLDRLLASPRYGERWGRHWLDIARYGDSNGLDENLAFANAHRYRDYVISAWNLDKPYDQFVREQIAGDLMTGPKPNDADDSARLERLTATGFLVLGAKMLAEDDPVKMQMDIVDEQLDTLGKAFLGLTLGCARCHDHKYDPVSMADYYGLAGIFKSTKTMENFSVVARWQERPLATAAELDRQRIAQARLDQLRGELTERNSTETQRVRDDVLQRVEFYLLAAAQQNWRDERLASVKSIGSSIDKMPANPLPKGALVVEAEEYARGNALRTRSGYGEGIGVILNAGTLPNIAEYEVAIADAGWHQLELRYAAAEARPLSLSINGMIVKPDAAGQVTGTWNPDSQRWFVEGVYQFAAGKNVVRLERAQPFPHLDKLLIAPAPDESTEQEHALAGVPAEVERPKTLRESYVRQWAAFLARTRDQAESPFAEWHAHARRLRGGAASAPEATARVLSGEPPKNWWELARGYGESLRAAEAQWRAFRATPEGKDAKALPDARWESLRAVLYDPQGPLAAPKDIEEYFEPDVRQQLAALRAATTAAEQAVPKFAETMAVSEGAVANVPVHLRGNHTSLGAVVERRVPRIVAGGSPPRFHDQASGRLEFAEWLTRPEQPLVARVFVNRLWHWHWGAGLVRSPDNFGVLGERPTHPALLDELAVRFMEHGWSSKRLHRELMSSATYRQSSAMRDEAFQRDPENRLWWRFSRRRLEAEAIRDSLLAAGGQLDLRMGGSHLTTPNRQYVTSTANVNPVVYETTRRSVYLPVVRSALYEVFQAFDFAEPSVLNGQRDSTIVATQALFMLNSGLVASQSRALADSLLAQREWNDGERLREAFLRTLGREPGGDEASRSLDFLARYSAALPADGAALAAEERVRRAWQALARVLLASNEFVFVE